MRYWFCLLFHALLTINVLAQQTGQTDHNDDDDDDDNRRPRIVGQKSISSDEDTPVTLQLTDLYVSDRDDWFYPWGFTMQVYEGQNYTFNGTTIIPAPDFYGNLSVPVTVNDGDEDSRKFDVQIEVRPINDAPVITGQSVLSFNEDETFMIQSSQLTINDPDDDAFTISISGGTNYTVSGSTITPASNFSGMLSIPVSVNDGEATSNVYNLQVNIVAVNDAPVITGQTAVETEENKPVTVQLSHLTVSDPDNTYPDDFTVTVLPSNNGSYTVSGNQVTPPLNFEGMLTVSVQVSDGHASSEPYNLQIKVIPGKDGPVITGQVPVSVNEDEVFSLTLSHLTVSDPNNRYPAGYVIKILPGKQYTFTDNVITPAADFNGTLSVNVVVTDGTNDSNIWGVVANVNPVNDAPEIVNLEETALPYAPGDGAVPVSETIEPADVDNDSLVRAVVNFKPGTYRFGVDELLFKGTGNITGNFDPTRGILTLSGHAPIESYVKAIRSVQYNFMMGVDFPFETKILQFTVSDGKADSDIAERFIGDGDMALELDIPTAFTPNGDAANDTWHIKPLQPSEELNKAIIRVYNKKGILLFEARGFEEEWDGRLDGNLLPADTYYYTIDLNPEHSRTLFKGIVTLLR